MLCCVGVVGRGVYVRVHLFHVQGAMTLFNGLCIVVYLWCYLICSVLFNLSGFYNVYFSANCIFVFVTYCICNVFLISLYRGPLCKIIKIKMKSGVCWASGLWGRKWKTKQNKTKQNKTLRKNLGWLRPCKTTNEFTLGPTVLEVACIVDVQVEFFKFDNFSYIKTQTFFLIVSTSCERAWVTP